MQLLKITNIMQKRFRERGGEREKGRGREERRREKEVLMRVLVSVWWREQRWRDGERERREEREKRDGTGTERQQTGRAHLSAACTLADVMQCDWTHCHISPGRTISRIFNNNS